MKASNETMVACLVILLSGCAEPPFWTHVKPERHSTQIRIEVVDDIRARCKNTTACAAWYSENKVCVIFIERGADFECESRHWEKHCNGYEHTGYSHEVVCGGTKNLLDAIPGRH